MRALCSRVFAFCVPDGALQLPTPHSRDAFPCPICSIPAIAVGHLNLADSCARNLAQHRSLTLDEAKERLPGRWTATTFYPFKNPPVRIDEDH